MKHAEALRHRSRSLVQSQGHAINSGRRTAQLEKSLPHRAQNAFAEAAVQQSRYDATRERAR